MGNYILGMLFFVGAVASLGWHVATAIGAPAITNHDRTIINELVAHQAPYAQACASGSGEQIMSAEGKRLRLIASLDMSDAERAWTVDRWWDKDARLVVVAWPCNYGTPEHPIGS